jgi:CubicO group peptidase (beta-lactamase class C family)
MRVWSAPYRTRHGRPVTVQDLMRHTSGVVGGKQGTERTYMPHDEHIDRPRPYAPHSGKARGFEG